MWLNKQFSNMSEQKTDISRHVSDITVITNELSLTPSLEEMNFCMKNSEGHIIEAEQVNENLLPKLLTMLTSVVVMLIISDIQYIELNYGLKLS